MSASGTVALPVARSGLPPVARVDSLASVSKAPAGATPAAAGLTPSGEDYRRNVIGLLDDLTRQSVAADLPEVPAELERLRRKLVENQFNLLVMGEAKRGKSTFINALLGASLLPTNVDISTCQVFRVRKSDGPSFRLRFEDGTAQNITEDDLATYGSQASQNATGEPDLDRILKWIEVDVPATFLPDGLVLLDTPGLGSLYSGHCEITHRFLPEADAVIFVLESGAPVGEPELAAIEQVLNVTDQIFFIQTGIDKYRREQWHAIQSRSQAILRERFGERLADARVWPVSSVNLMQAAATGDDSYEMVSRHRELAPALKGFLDANAGARRAQWALLVANELQQNGRLILQGRLKSLTAESQEERSALRDRIKARREQFDADWGPRGAKWQELQSGIRRAREIAKAEFRSLIQPAGRLETDYRDEIEKLASVDAAVQFRDCVQSELIDRVANGWKAVTGGFQTACLSQIARLMPGRSLIVEPEAEQGGSTALILGKFPHESNSTSLTNPAPTLKKDTLAKLQRGLFCATGLSLLSNSAYLLLAGTVGPQLAVVGGLYVAYRLFRYGWDSTREVELATARQQLRQFVDAVLRDQRQFFFDADASENRFGRMEEFFESAEREVLGQIASAIGQESKEAEREIRRLTEQAQLGDARRAGAGTRLQQTIAQWEELGNRIGAPRD